MSDFVCLEMLIQLFTSFLISQKTEYRFRVNHISFIACISLVKFSLVFGIRNVAKFLMSAFCCFNLVHTNSARGLKFYVCPTQINCYKNEFN